MMAEATVHASAVLVGGRGVLIRGASGSGKSALVLALLFGGHDAVLVADDRVVLSAAGGQLSAAVPSTMAGLLEVRGTGIVRLPNTSPALIELIVDLWPLADCPRLPEPDLMHAMVEGVSVRRIFVAQGAPDGAFRVRAALADRVA